MAYKKLLLSHDHNENRKKSSNMSTNSKKRMLFDVQTKENIINGYSNQETKKLTVENIIKTYLHFNVNNQEKIRNVIVYEIRPQDKGHKSQALEPLLASYYGLPQRLFLQRHYENIF